MRKLFTEFTPEKLEQVRTHPYYKNARETIIARADNYTLTDPPVMKFSKIHLYVECGNREIFEKDRIEYETRLHALFLAYIITEDDKYLSPLSDIIWGICNFESWSIPAHVAEDLSIADRRRNLDLCSCIFGYRLSEILYLIGDKLPELVYRRAKAEVQYRIIDSFANHKDERYFWLTTNNNWAAVCIAGVLCSYLYLATDEEIEAELPRMIEIADNYLAGFEEDGCCTEGYAYWNYGFSFFCLFAKMLSDYTDGEINYFKSEKVHNIAMFQQNILLNENECLSFSDGGLSFEPYSWLSHFLKGIYPDMQLPALPDECITDYSTAPLPNGTPIRYIFWTNPDYVGDILVPKSHRFKNAEWFLYHSKNYSLGAKAGHNDEFHNHNDVGSFLISKGGRVTFCDPGGGEYTKDYFDPKHRYSIFVTSGRAHSVPIINGEYQAFGKREGCVEIFDEDRFRFSMKGGYDIDTLTSLVRDFECLEDSVRLTDTYEFSETPTSVTERFVSLLPIEEKDGALLCGDSVLVFDRDAFDISYGSEVVARKRAEKETVYYVDLSVKAPKKQFELTFIIK
ncbi:MAG: heparinase II/III family protein [Clostridia bacterium]|nr:heparinase II/III family protein [Clostridia bacterium]